MKRVLVIAPHPDDETLGCGGTLLRHKSQGDEVYWIIVTGMSELQGFSSNKISSRKKEIEIVAELYGLDSYYNLNLPTTKLDTLSVSDILGHMSSIFQKVRPEIVYLPYRGDAHTDHKLVFDAVIACTKWFRCGSIKRLLSYETLSETDFCLNPDNNGFRPNVFINIADFLEMKIKIMKVYDSELAEFPFPRSEYAIRALATLRGAASGCEAAEAFMLLKETL